jgi:K(+)-stimulated pyrophosphate-energized sodium pump
MAAAAGIGGVCIITSIIGTYFVKLGASNNIMGALYKGLIVTGVLSIPASGGLTGCMFGGMRSSTDGGLADLHRP